MIAALASPTVCIFLFFMHTLPERKDDKMEDKDNKIFAAASSGECTGLIPEGGNHTPEEIERYKDIVPFAMPAKDKGYDKAEMRRIEKQNRI